MLPHSGGDGAPQYSPCLRIGILNIKPGTGNLQLRLQHFKLKLIKIEKAKTHTRNYQ